MFHLGTKNGAGEGVRHPPPEKKIYICIQTIGLLKSKIGNSIVHREEEKIRRKIHMIHSLGFWYLGGGGIFSWLKKIGPP